MIALLVVGVLLWFMLSAGPQREPPLTPVIDTVVQDGTVYTNEQYGISLQYGNDFTVYSADQNIERPWSFVSDVSGTRLFTIVLPREFQPRTNFSNAEIGLGVSTDRTAVENCVLAQGGETTQGNQQGFAVFTSTDAGAGNFYETTSRRIGIDSACIALESVIHSTNIGNYPAEQGITEYNRALVQAVIDTVMSTAKVE